MNRTSEIDSRQELERRLCQNSLAHYVYTTARHFIFEAWHILLFDYLEALFKGDITRFMAFVAPRAGKSEVISVLFPSWAVGKRPSTDILQLSYAKELAAGFGRRVRDIVLDPDFQATFPGVHLNEMLRGAMHWQIENPDKDAQNGTYWAAGVEGGIAGKGFDLGILDDPHSEQDRDSPAALKRVSDWFGPGFRSRRQATGITPAVIALIMTRWNPADLAGFLMDEEKQGGEFADKWTKLKIPAILDKETADRLRPHADTARHFNQLRENAKAAIQGRTPKTLKAYEYEEGGSYAPQRWPMHELKIQQAGMSSRDWQALYLQNPSEEQGNILQRSWWKPWDSSVPPNLDYVISAYDTAYEEDSSADYSARTTWGAFTDQTGLQHLILTEAWRARVSFPELKKEVKNHHKHTKPDVILVEKRASGTSLVQELKRTGMPIVAWLPPGITQAGKVMKSRAKIPLAHAVAGIFESGRVHYMTNNREIEDVLDECAEFPFSKNDDYVSTVVMAVLRLRKGNMVDTDQDQDEEDEDDQDNDQPYTRRGLRLVASRGQRLQ